MKTATMSPEPSRPVRHRCTIAGKLIVPQTEASEIVILDLSVSGVFVETDAELQVGDDAVLQIRFPELSEFEVPISVARLGTAQHEISHPQLAHLTLSKPGIGAHFMHESEETQRLIRRILEILDER